MTPLTEDKEAAKAHAAKGQKADTPKAAVAAAEGEKAKARAKARPEAPEEKAPRVLGGSTKRA